MRILITGGCGFIGSHLVRHMLKQNAYEVLNVDSLTYAGNKENLLDVENSENYHFINANIRDRVKFREIFKKNHNRTKDSRNIFSRTFRMFKELLFFKKT